MLVIFGKCLMQQFMSENREWKRVEKCFIFFFLRTFFFFFSRSRVKTPLRAKSELLSNRRHFNLSNAGANELIINNSRVTTAGRAAVAPVLLAPAVTSEKGLWTGFI